MSDTHTLVPSGQHAQGDCAAVTDVLARIGDKWTVVVVGALSHGPMRYSQILKAIDGVSQRMLTLTLKGLERDGLVTRTVYPTNPPRVDYTLWASAPRPIPAARARGRRHPTWRRL